MRNLVLLAALLASTAAQPAWAHATIGGDPARIGQPFTAHFNIPHGCAGQPTVEVIVQVPPGFLAVEPVQVEGWTATSKTGRYDEAHTLGEDVVAEGVTEVSWTGGSLPDGEHATFALEGVFATDLEPGPVYFPLVQVCPEGEAAWIDHDQDADKPAPSVQLER